MDMKKFTVIFIGLLLLHVDAREPPDNTQERFSRCVYSEDSSCCVESRGIVGTGAVHASDAVVLTYDLKETGKFTAVYGSGGQSYLPIITELHIIKKVYPLGTIAFALGWSTFGEGSEYYTGWFIRFDKMSSVIQWFRVVVPRSFPGIGYDENQNEVRILINKRNLDRIKKDQNASILTSEGVRIDLMNLQGRLLPAMDAVLYTNHPYGETKSDITDSLFCLARIRIEETGFKFVPLN
jgi:hypothetical protein